MKIQIRIAKEMAEAGKSIQEIADAIGYNHQGVLNILNRNKIEYARQRRGPASTFDVVRLRELFAGGATIKDVSQEIGVSAANIYAYCNRHKIAFKKMRPGRRVGSAGQYQKPEIISRNHNVIAAFNAGKTLEEIGNQFNITRERVRQIVKKNGMKSRRQSQAEHANVLAEKIKGLSATVFGAKGIAAQVGVSACVVNYIAAKHGIPIKPDIILNAKAAEIEAAVQMVASGKSLSKSVAVVGLGRSSHLVVSEECRKRGIKMCHGRWGRDPATYSIARKAKAIAERAVARAEKATAKAAALAKKAAAPQVKKPAAKAAALAKKAAAPQVKKPCMNIPPAPQDGVSIRDYCVANKGKHTAAEIAAAIGKTRNSVIGHWFRAGATQ